jgi:HEAT repeat protein
MSTAEIDGWLAELAAADADLRATAAMVLGGVAKRYRTRVLRALRLALDDPDEVVANFAAQSLAQLGDIESLPAIERFLATGRPRNRSGSAWAVSELDRLADEPGQLDALAALRAFHRRARGWSRAHATAHRDSSRLCEIESMDGHVARIPKAATDGSQSEWIPR